MKFKDRQAKTESSLPFIKLGDGQSVTGSFAGDPVEFYQHWLGNRSMVCTGHHGCEYCAKGERASFRFRINLIVKEADGKGLVAKVFENSGTVYDYLKKLDEKYKGLERVPVEITRHGEGKSTSYVILPEQPFNDRQLAVLAKVPLVDLAPQPAASVPAEDVVEETVDDMPF